MSVNIPDIGPIKHLINSIDDIRLVVKDLRGHYIYVNRCWLTSNGLKSLEDVLGKTAKDLFPTWRAERYLREEQHVIQEQITYDYEEHLLNSDGELELWRTVKSPWIEEGQVKGYVNIGTRLDSKELEQRSDKIPQVVQTIAQHACQNQSIDKLAQSIGVSRRTLERRFKQAMDLSPQEFRIKCRVLQAKKMLREGTKSIDVASACGFTDQSHFSKTFSQHIGQSPKQYQMTQKRLVKAKAKAKK